MVFKQSRSIAALTVLAAISRLSQASAVQECPFDGADGKLNFLQNGIRQVAKSAKENDVFTMDAGDAANASKVVFVKTHCTGSSTMAGIFQRRCSLHNETCARAVPGRYVGETVLRAQLIAYAKKHHGENVQIWPWHVDYDRQAFEEFMPGATTVTLVREPMSRLMSCYSHRADVDRTELVHEALHSWQSNQTTRTQSFPMTEQVPSISDMDFVMLTEDYDRSVVLLAMKLGWKLQDVLYMRIRESPPRSPKLQKALGELKAYLQQPLATLPEKAQEFVQQYLIDDGKLYEAANMTYHKQLAALTRQQHAEVEKNLALLQSAVTTLTDCCNKSMDDSYCAVLAEDAVSWHWRMDHGLHYPAGVLDSHCRHEALRALGVAMPSS